MKQGVRTKNGRYFTLFSIKAILQNPVYMTTVWGYGYKWGF